MRLALYDDNQLGAVTEAGIVPLSHQLPWPHDPDPLTAGWWRLLCQEYPKLRAELAAASAAGAPQQVATARLRAPVLNPSKVLACASNYAEHVHEMHEVQERTLGEVTSWMMNFDVFLKAPSSISGPAEPIRLPPEVVAAGQEIHHESELVIVLGKGGKDIPTEDALSHVFGYTIGLDITVRGAADRSRRKSYDTFSPTGPWLVTADELTDPGDLDIQLTANGEQRQRVHTSTLITAVPEIISYASRMMTLLPGDLIFTGAPPGVGPINSGDRLHTTISRIGELRLDVV
ncbi:2-keto-4-pentenoate hydratase/2-oxohepta-3-ene-1,7-dioic acid hydratase in catechol pathway [Tamaricihabitans halophyticus]|uniref:2-keto-4-pentenoate hydratase/2-oxohepta-3-ene-1,7-dioic acid hydratase in catechol pathway n=1 Tax=Tamaricihabitans halophyticus TaxID=1262583 RepID=A0A4R2R5Y5_9PSEU|nr:fumarylacetoacetate hydrolase family protein [Tamaricihabitans halophyticus]TCP57208.1 2-keto-4-pentenoate hydratase/2-oxohepta-3-ene-1,7-dioic acid hydratase in catechol pathway [Tamaricihabitans halophyticus]